MKLWSGRFSKDIDQTANDFNQSISFDKRLYADDISGSIAHVHMLAKCKIITEPEAEAIASELKKIKSDIESGALDFDKNAEDIHMFIETVLTERIGDIGKKLHTARSRNDQIALDIRMYLKRQIVEIKQLLHSLMLVILHKAKQNIDTIMPGYTHLQRAQPTTFAHHLLAYTNMFRRDMTRLNDCYDRMDEMPLGSGAFATSTYPIDRNMVASELGFKKVTDNSMDAVSDRDFVCELAFDLSMIMMHLSRFCEEIILWCSWEFKFLELDDAFATGSSIMPQKKNPDMAELARGKTGRVYGSLFTLLTMLKGLPLAYNKDMQEDKEAVFDAVDNTKLTLKVFTSMLETASVYKDNMLNAAKKGFINATDCADYLVKKGMPFRDAYKATGQLVKYCCGCSKTLDQLTLDEYKSVSDKFDKDVYSAIDLYTCVANRKVYSGPSQTSITEQIKKIEDFLSSD